MIARLSFLLGNKEESLSIYPFSFVGITRVRVPISCIYLFSHLVGSEKMARPISYFLLELFGDLPRLDGQQLTAKRCGIDLDNPITSGTNRGSFCYG
jgi:hypothetical protein